MHLVGVTLEEVGSPIDYATLLRSTDSDGFGHSGSATWSAS